MGGHFWSRLRRVVFGLALFFLVFESVSAAIVPVARAQTNTQTQICTPENTILITTASVSTAFVAPYSSGLNLYDVGTKITATTTFGVALTRVEASVYRATTTAENWSKVGTVSLSNQGQITNTWTGEYTGGLPDGAYRLFVLVKGYSKINSTETLKTQGCSTPQLVTKGKSDSAKFCEGATTAREVGFTANIAVKQGKSGNAEKGEPAVFELTVTLQKGLRNATQPQVSVKRALEGAAHVLTTIQGDVPLGNTTDVGTNQKAWKPEVSDKPTSAGKYRYYVLGEVTVNGKKYTTCGNVFNGWGNPDNTVEGETVSLDTLRKWFAGSNNAPYKVSVFTEEGKKPIVIVAGDDGSGRPDIVFKLAYIFGNGGTLVDTATSPIDSRQLDWTTFETYAIRRDANNNSVESRITGVTFSLDDRGLDGLVEYWEDESNAATRRVDPVELQRWAVTKESYTDLYARIYDVPKDPSSDNCLDKDGVTKVGPAGKGADVEISDRGYETSNLSGNCINLKDYGWASHWGVKGASIPADLTKDCAVQGFLKLFTEGIGVMIAKMLGCLVAELFKGVVNTIQPLLCEAASRSMLTTPAYAADSGALDCESLKNNSPVQSSIDKPSLTSFFIGTAHAQNIGSNHRFEQELKNPNSVIVRIWGYSRSLLNIIVVAALLAIAFANIFHFNINTYAAKKMIPGLVIGVVAANGSLLIVRFLADVTQAVSQLAIDLMGTGDANAFAQVCGILEREGRPTIGSLISCRFPNAIGEASIVGVLGSLAAAGGLAVFTGGFSLLAWVLLMIVLVCYYAFLVIAFAITFIKRVVLLYFLSMVAPLAFVAYGVPQFQKYFFQWWDMFLRQLFVFPIILFGMSATVLLSSQLNLGDYGNVLNPTNFISGLVSIILVMSAATMVLKLPKIFTKGALDVAATLKKALNQAPRVVQGAQGLHNFAAGGGKERLRGTLASFSASRAKDPARKAALEALAKDRLEEARKRKLAYGKGKLKDAAGNVLKDLNGNEIPDLQGRVVGGLKKARGYSTLFARPELLKDALDTRKEREGKDDFIAAMTKTDRIPGKIRGPIAEGENAKKLALDELKDARTLAEFKDWMEGMGAGHMKARRGLHDRMREVAKDDNEFELMRQKLGSMGTEAMLEFIEAPVEKGGLGIANMWDTHDLMKVSGLEKRLTEAANRARSTKKKGADNIKDVDPWLQPGGTPFAGAGAQSASGQPAAPVASSAQIANYTDEQIQNRIEEIFNHGLALDPNMKGELQERLIQNLDVLSDLEQMNPGDGLYADAFEKTRKTLLDAVGASAGVEADALREAIRQANDPAQLTRLTENLSIAAAAQAQGGNTRESVASVVAQANQGTREFHQAHNELMSQADLSKLEQAITSSLQAGGQDMADVLSRELGEGVNKLSQTLGKQLNPEEQRKMFQQMATQIQGTMVGPGQKTLRAVLQNSLQSLPKTFAKVVGVHTLQPKAMEVRVVNQPPAQQPPETPPPAAPTS